MSSNSMGIQKANHLFLEMDKKKPDINKHYMMFEKYDGWYGYLDFPSCIITSRQHREIPALKELSDLIRTKRPNTKGRLIFEIMIEGLEVDSFHELNGILNRKSEQAENVYLRVHDFIPDFQFCTMPTSNRYAFAMEIVRRIDLRSVLAAPLLGLSNKIDEWQHMAAKIQARGGEGLILKDKDSFYHPNKRISSLMKIKEEVSTEMLVTNVVEATGDHVGMVGKLICKDENNQLHEIGMGCATHNERISWLQDTTLIINKVVEIKAMKKLKDGKYREPRFKAIRYDKAIHELG